MLNIIMGDSTVPLFFGLLLLTCWTRTTLGGWMDRSSEASGGDPMRIGRRIDTVPPVPELGDWKPIDYGHPMRNDPTLVYVPPVVDPVHYGIHSAEPLWPIRGHKLPPFTLTAEAMTAAASTDRQWMRLRPPFRPDGKDGPPLKAPIHTLPAHSEVNARSQQRVDDQNRERWSSKVQPLQQQQYQRRPVQSTVWTGQDLQTGRAPATIRPSLLTTLSPLVSQRGPENYAVSNSSGRRNQLNPTMTQPDNQHPSSTRSNGMSIDRVDSSLAEEVEGRRKWDLDIEQQNNKRLRRPFLPFNFIIQQGHSKVRKYGSQ